MPALLAVASFTLSSGRNGLRALSYALKERPSHASISPTTAGLGLMSARGGEQRPEKLISLLIVTCNDGMGVDIWGAFGSR